MERTVMHVVYRGLSNNLHACIDTGNPEEAAHVVACAKDALQNRQITMQQRADLQADFDTAFPDYQ
jgi:hypothetical protein